MAQASPGHPAPMAMTAAEMEAAIAALPGKRDALREAFDRLAACIPSPLPFAWDDLDGHISSLQSSIALRIRQLRALEAAGAAALGGTRGDGKGENQELQEEVAVEVEEEEAELEKKAGEEIQEADRDKFCNDGKKARVVEVEEEVAEPENADEEMHDANDSKICNDGKDRKETREVEVEVVAELEKKADEVMQEADCNKFCNDEKDKKEAREEVEEGEIEEASVMISNEMKDEEAREEEQDSDKAMQMVDKGELNTKDAFMASQDKQEQEAQEQDVHDKVEGAQNATDKVALVANEVSSDQGNRAPSCRSDDCTVACANMDAERMLKLICTITELNSKFLAAFRCAPDAAALALHVVELFLHNKILVKTNKVWKNCVGLVQMVPAVVTKPSAETIEQAKQVAKDWKKMIENRESCKFLGSLPSWGLLYFLVSYNIVTEFHTKEIFCLFGNIPCKQMRKSAMLLKGLGLGDKIPELMDYLIGNGQQLNVFWLARSFHMVGKHSPLFILKGYVEKAKQTAMEISQKNMTHQLRAVIRKELNNLRRAHILANKKEITDSNLCTRIREEINVLIGEFEKKQQNLENPLTASTSDSQQLQTKSKKELEIEQKQEHHMEQENQMRGQLSELAEKLEKKQRKKDEEMHEANSNKICNDEKGGKETGEVEVEVVSELEKKAYEVMLEADYEDRKEAGEEVLEEGEILEAANVMIGNEMKDDEAREDEQDPNKAMQMVHKEELNTKHAFKASQDKEEEDQDTNMDKTAAKMVSPVQACGKKQEQEHEAQEQDVHYKVEGAKNATDKEVVVANEVSSDQGNWALPCRSDDGTVACANMDPKRLLKLICTNIELNSKFRAAFLCAPDAAALALHVVELFLHKIFYKTDKVWANCVGLVQMVPAVVTKPSADTIEQAKRVAKDWKEMIDNPESCKVLGSVSLTSWGLLYFLVSYNIVTEFDTKEIFCLFGNIPLEQKKKSAMLLRGLGLGNKIPELMDYLIENGQQMDVLCLAHNFNMVDKYPPLSLLLSLMNGYIEKAKQTAMEIPQKNMTCKFQKEVIRKELDNLRRAHGLTKKEVTDSNLCTRIREEINILIGIFEKKKQNLENPLIASTSNSQLQQTKSKMNLKIEQKQEHHKGQKNQMRGQLSELAEKLEKKQRKKDEEMHEANSNKICNDEKDRNETGEVEVEVVSKLEKKADEVMQEADYEDMKEAREEVFEQGEIVEAANVMIGNEMKDDEAREEEQDPDKAMQMVDKEELNSKDAFKASHDKEEDDQDTDMDKTATKMASSVQACGKKQKQEHKAQEQDVHYKVEGGKNAMAKEAVVANEVSSDWGNRALPCRSNDCTVACANMDAEWLLKLICTNTEFNSKFHAAFLCAPDAAALALHVVKLFLHNKIFDKTNKVWANFVGLVQMVPAFVTKPSADTIEQAKQVAKDWKEMIDNPQSCKVLGSLPLSSCGLLYFLVSYNIVTEFDKKVLFCLFGNIPLKQKKKSAMLLRGLGLGNKIPELMDYLIENGQQMDVLCLARNFNMVDKYPPLSLLLSLLNGYIGKAKQTAMEIPQKNITCKFQKEVIRKELDNLRRAHGLTKKEVTDSNLCTRIREEINILIGIFEKKKQNLENPLTASTSNSQLQQTKSKMNLNIEQKQEHHKGQENQMRGQLSELAEKLEKKQMKPRQEQQQKQEDRPEEKKQKQEDDLEGMKQKQKGEPEEKKRKQEDKPEEKQQQKRLRQHTHQLPTPGYPATLRGGLECPPYATMHLVHHGYPGQPSWLGVHYASPFMPQLVVPEYIGPFTPLYPRP